MSYLNQAENSRRRNAAIVAVVAVHALVGYGLVTGLTFTAFKKIRDYTPTFEFKDPPPPPPPPDPAVQPDVPVDPPIAAPVPPLDLTPIRPPIDVVIADPLPTPPLPIPRTPVENLQVPKPQPSFAPKAARPRNDPARWVMTEDYPSSSLRLDEEGTTGFAVIVGSDGRVDACEIVKSSGSARLDEATCRNVEKRARFEPATDANGAKVVGRYTSTVRWQIPR